MPIKTIRCIRPFHMMQFGTMGLVWTCCPSWTRLGPIGDLDTETDVMKIWNSPTAVQIRRAVLENRMDSVCRMDFCPFAVARRNIPLDDETFADPNLKQVAEQIRAGKSELDTPPAFLNISDAGDCNLRCIMCRAHSGFVRKDRGLSDRIFGTILPRIIPRTSYLILNGNGDPFCRKETRDFLVNPENVARYPNLKIQLITNALLLDRAMWEKVGHNRFDDITVSVDAATKATYEKIRRGGRWETLKENLELVARLRKEGAFPRFQLNYLVMTSNHAEIRDFAEYGLSLGADEIVFQRVSGLLDCRENFAFTRNVPVLSAIGRVLQDPLFSDPRVNASEIRFCTRYAGRRPTPFARARTFLLETLPRHPVRAYYRFRHWLAPVYKKCNRWKRLAFKNS